VAARIFEGVSKPARCVALCFDIKCPETKDNDFTWKDFQARNNNELVAIYGISLTL
jgi:methionyl-tRNA synthetase